MGRRRTQVARVVGLLLVTVPLPAQALELSTGIGVGGVLAGTVPHIGVSPQVRLLWRLDNGVIFTAQGMPSILVPSNQDGVGLYVHTAGTVGYAWEERDFSLGPSLSAYDIVACGVAVCGRVVGLAPGGHAQVNAYFLGPLGISASVDVDWIGGRSLVLHGSGVATTIVAGPVLRWTARR